MKIPFFSKRAEEKRAAEAAARQEVVDSFAQRIEDAKTLPDAGERILKLQDVANDVDDVVSAMSGDATKAAELKRKVLFWTAMPAGIAASAIYPPALLGLIGMGASIYGGNKLSHKFRSAAEKGALDKHRPFFDALYEQKKKALATQDALVITDGPAIAKSPLFPDILAKSPHLREAFAAAYSRKLNEEDAQKNAAPASKRWIDDPNFKFDK
jgi:hypothetical protein